MEHSPLNIWFLEDEAADVELVRHTLSRAGLEVHLEQITSEERFRERIDRETPDLVLSDRGFPGFDGFAALAMVRNRHPDLPFIFVTGSLGEEAAIDAFERGANDFVLKGRLEALEPAVRRALIQGSEHRRNRQARQIYHHIVHGAPDAIVTINDSGVVVEWNPAAEQMFGYGAGEAIGSNLLDLVIPDHERSECSADLVARITRMGKQDGGDGSDRNAGSLHRECAGRHRNGTEFPMELSLVHTPTEGRSLWTAFLRDVSHHKRVEAEIARLNSDLEVRVAKRTEELQAANRELEAFSYSVSHDLRAPLRHIEGFVELLRLEAGPKLDETSLDYLRIITDATRRMGKLIDALLTFSRTARVPIHKGRVRLDQLLESVRHDLRFDAEGRHVEWVIPPLPEVRGDPSLLRQVFINLLSNALKYTRVREIARIEVNAQARDGEVVVEVRDNGVGFDMRYAEKLFGVFQRLHSPNEYEGAGIGLANVRRIVLRHGGRVWAESSPGRGASFFFSLPMEE